MEKIKYKCNGKNKELFIIDEDAPTVKNNLEELLIERGVSPTDIDKLTGITKQRLNNVTKDKVVPGLDLALKVSYVLGMTVEEIFELTPEAWMRPYKENNEKLYFNIVTKEIVSEVDKNKFYYNEFNNTFYSIKKIKELERKYKDQFVDIKKHELVNDYDNLKKLNSDAREEVKKDFYYEYKKVYRELFEKIDSYQLE